jgi:hypothetical protein
MKYPILFLFLLLALPAHADDYDDDAQIQQQIYDQQAAQEEQERQQLEEQQQEEARTPAEELQDCAYNHDCQGEFAR